MFIIFLAYNILKVIGS